MRFSLAAAALVPVMSASAANILVQVGAGGKLAFSPSNITAQVGDVIAFQFQGKNHSVTQSTFATPCAIQTAPAQGIDSGFQFVAPNATELPQWSFTVDNATSPLWFFCAQTNPAVHCAAGMVFSVNANEASPKNFAAFQASAMASGGAAAAGAAAGSAAGSAIGAATSAIGAGVGDATSAIGGAAGAAATDAANALSGVAGAATGLANALTGSGASATGAANGTAPNAAGRTTTSAMSLVAVLGLTAGLLL
ncbi:hypothetical protein C8F04DRAFT_219531 [Mycena alexandri]|uniref:Phytocyanin domain-containing protein n=1 Tax=Mycena alexandri TaxID=1745969 RepID=A0AAD6TMW4_9AGAR|nr:hypothetical protein C8F04DRAFT_219531 [Mycena alexandri]